MNQKDQLCPVGCGAQKGQHSNSQSGKCDAMKKGKQLEWAVLVGKKI